MPSVALSTLGPDCARYLGFFRSVATTTNIGAGVTVISTGLGNLGHDYDDALNGSWVFIKGTANALVSRMVDDFTGSTGTSTVRGANLAAESGSVTVEFYPVSHADILTVMNKMRITNYREFALPRKYLIPTLRGNQRTFPLPNGLFEGAPTEIHMRPLNQSSNFSRNFLAQDEADFATVANWTGTTMTTVSTVSPEADADYQVPLIQGQAVGYMVTDGTSVAATVLNALDTTYGRLLGLSLGFEVWVYCLTASRLKARINESASTSDSAFHNGLGWELLQVSRSLGAAGTVSVGVVDTTNTAALRFYMAHPYAVQGPIEIAEEEFVTDAPPWEYVPPYGTDTNGFVRFNRRLPANYVLEIRGNALLSSVSAQADTMEIDSQRAELLYAYTAEELAKRELASGRPNPRFIDWQQVLNKATLDIPRLKQQIASRGDGVVVKARHPVRWF